MKAEAFDSNAHIVQIGIFLSRFKKNGTLVQLIIKDKGVKTAVICVCVCVQSSLGLIIALV